MAAGIIVGAGRAGAVLHWEALHACGADVTAFVDTDPAKAALVARERGVPRSYGDLQEALDAERPQFVSICTNTASHFVLARMSLEAGAHVLLEKPVTASLAEASELQRVSAVTARSVTAVHNHRFYPGVEAAVQLCREGHLGAIIHVDREMHFCHDRVRMMEQDHWAQQIPGGRLFEANPHNLYLVFQFLGPMALAHIHGQRFSSHWPWVRHDGFTATLVGERQATAQITMSMAFASSPHQPRHAPNLLCVYGERGSILVDYHSYRFLDSPRQTFASRIRQEIARTRSVFQKKAASRTGHYYLIAKFLAFIDGREAQAPTSWPEILEVQRLNDEMGQRLATT